MSQKLLPSIPKTAATDWRPIEVISSDDKKSSRPLKKPWRPITLQVPFLTAMIVSTAALIVLVQCLLAISNRQQGLIFAKDINTLPLSRTFAYLYLPTIISVAYSFLWTWVDLDVKRLEPFFQLSRPGGAKASESILLSYPLEFLVTIPLTAFKRRHWSVLNASTIMILVFWGLTPTQAGIFAVREVQISRTVPGNHATGYTPIAQQGNVSASYAQSVYNIAWLNETLPRFMTADFVLQAFGPSEPPTADESNANYTGLTTLYSVDLDCELATLLNRSGIWYYNSSDGCSFNAPRYRPAGGTDQTKPFDTLYVGYQNENGFAQYDLSSECDEQFFHLFFLRWSKSTQSAILSADKPSMLDPTQANETSLFCRASYFQQAVNATIDVSTGAVLDVFGRGSKSSLPADLFNVSTFEWAINSGLEETPVRTDFPSTYFPEQQSQLLDMSLNLAYVPPMAPFAIATDHQLPDAYLDPAVLRSSYQSAYRLLFARQLKYALGNGSMEIVPTIGSQAYSINAVVVVPAFAYATTALLACILILAFLLLGLICRRPNKLRNDLATISSLMALVVGKERTIDKLRDFDKATSKDIERKLRDKHLSLETAMSKNDVQLDCLESPARSPREAETMEDIPGNNTARLGVRPAEMKMLVGLAFLTIQVAAAVCFMVLYIQAKRHNGLPLPSQSTIVRQIVENYIPIAFATFIEPFWLVLNRLLGLLQPFESLRKGNANAAKSVDLDYSSLPPQLLFVRAIKAGHIVLATLCLMVLLANILSVALSGLMFEGTADISHTRNLTSTKTAVFRPLNGTGTPFNSNKSVNFQGSTTMEQFYREMSNLSAGTPLPAWNDGHFAYVPLDLSSVNDTGSIEVETKAIGAGLACKQLNTTGAESYYLHFGDSAEQADLVVHLTQANGSTVNCTNGRPWTKSNGNTKNAMNGIENPAPGRNALELNAMLSSPNNNSADDLFCRQHVVAAWIRADIEEANSNDEDSVSSDLMEVSSSNETVLACTPSLAIRNAIIIVNSEGQVQDLQHLGTNNMAVETLRDNLPNVIAQADQFLMDSGGQWHTDSYPSDFVNYLIKTATNDTSLLDPAQSTPDPDEAGEYLSTLYPRLFAMLVSTNLDLLLEDAPTPMTVTASVTIPETRILLSKPAFIVTETILICYIITTIVFYVRRPWRMLPRLPATVASNIAFFAASRALLDLAVSDEKSVRERISEWKWGYGILRDGEGKVHVGIEREPFVTAWRRPGDQKIRWRGKREEEGNGQEEVR